ncbi:hypothetical protein NM688_g7198 [Phlebia brevispora]|uniref:Uncharacterized protein n=1 Tax=Phlebia brevispora TaxID=194682 RepID=A0ACC1S882_9APHY|nr:hypothetical protein NM688_g7198 [Phlebia brevispora]
MTHPQADLCACLSSQSFSRSGKKIFIPFQPVFSLGRDPAQCDYIFPPEDRYVDAVHAQLLCGLSQDGKQYQLRVQISGKAMYKFFVNSKLMEYGARIQLKADDVLTFGDQGSHGRSFKLFVYTPNSMQSKFDVGQVIGRGGFGMVYKVRSRKSGSIYALKVVKAKNNNGQPDEIARREVQNMRNIRHPFIVKLTGCFLETSFIYMILELGSGTIADVVYPRGPQEPKAVDERYVCRVAAMICQALLYLHDTMHMIHRDIKPQNLLRFPHDVIKLADFGLSKDMSQDSGCQTFCGTTAFMAPEIPCGAYFNYSYPADLYSLGATLYVMLSGTHVACASDQLDFSWPHMLISQEGTLA